MRPNPRRIAPILLLVLAAAATAWYFAGRQAQAEVERLVASGTIEATQVIVAPELGGQVSEVLVEEGQVVRAGQFLVRFSDELLRAQLRQAEANLAQAQANYELVAAGLSDPQRRSAIAAAELELLSAQQALDDLYENASLMAAQALREIALAERAIDNASQRRENLLAGADEADIDAARASVVLARERLDQAEEAFEPYRDKPEDNLKRAALLNVVAEAEKVYDAAVTRLNNLVGETNEIDLAIAEADLALAEEQLADAQRRYERVKVGADPEALSLARARVESAEARLEAARAGPSQEQLAVARTQVEAAQAALAVLQVQMDKLLLTAPMDGMLLTRSVEPGEVVLPGAPLLTLARLDDLTITVYVPEDRYGTIRLGERARVSVDSFPGQEFRAGVVHIADRAEFTPRNVQTAEGRRSTVFAVKLAIENPEGRLKPGMPADVTFGE